MSDRSKFEMVAYTNSEKEMLKWLDIIERHCCRRHWWQFWLPKDCRIEYIYATTLKENEE